MTAFSFPRRSAFRVLLVLAAVFVVAGALPAKAQSPAAMAGVLTRWQMSSKTACLQTFNDYASYAALAPQCPRSLMFSISPYLAGLPLQNWVDTLASAGVNTATIFVLPGDKLAVKQTISDGEWQAYNQYLYLPQASLTDAQKHVILQVGQAISLRQFTVAQRDDAIVAFLAHLQADFPNSTPVKFILDERVWFINRLDANGDAIPTQQGGILRQEQIFAGDISSIVQQANAQQLDRWIQGVRLSEYGLKNWNVMGPVMVDLATLINQQTSGWMKSHTFIGAGGGWGLYWKGINAMQCPQKKGWQFAPCTGTFPFFQLMSQQVGYFAFGEKFMEFGKPQAYTLNGQDTGTTYLYTSGMAASFCQTNTAAYKCENPATPTVKDWQAALEDNIDGWGFSDLVQFLNANAQKYPQIANVIFDGDSADALATALLPPYVNGATAISNLFKDAVLGSYTNVETGAVTTGLHLGTWTGKIFLNGFDDPSTVPRVNFFGDAGLSMFQTNNNGFMFSPSSVTVYPRKTTTLNWVNWP